MSARKKKQQSNKVYILKLKLKSNNFSHSSRTDLFLFLFVVAVVVVVGLWECVFTVLFSFSPYVIWDLFFLVITSKLFERVLPEKKNQDKFLIEPFGKIK